MAFSVNDFLANMQGSHGPAKSWLFEVILPIPAAVGSYVESSALDQILNLPNTIFNDVTSAITSSINDFLAPTGLAVATSSPASISRYLSLQCESAELPGKRLDTMDVTIYGPSFKVPYKVNYDAMTLTFICTNVFQERQLFDRWLEAIAPLDTNNFRFPKGEDSRYMTDIIINQFNDFGEVIYSVKLIDAFPFDLGHMPLSWGSNSLHRLSVQFAYQRWETIPQDQIASFYPLISLTI